MIPTNNKYTKQFVYTKDGTYDLNNPTDKLMKSLLDGVAEYDNAIRAERSRLGKMNISKSNVYKQYLAYHQGHAGYASGRYKSSDAIKAVARRTSDTAKLFKTQLTKCN